MSSYPLIRTKWSNERVMAIVFVASMLYALPVWVQKPADVLNFAAILALSLVIDVAANFIRYKRPTCAVSAAVTASVLYALSAGIPLWEQLLAVIVALVAGKHIWGGTGKNPVNPAIVGLLFLALCFNVDVPVFVSSWLLIPAVLASLPFIIIRPFAASGMMAGMALSLLLDQSLTAANALSSGIIFWSCLVITDPTTMTSKPITGAIVGFMAGIAPMYLGVSAAAMAAAVLLANVLSFAADAAFKGAGLHKRLRFKKNEHISYSADNTMFYDMTEYEDVKCDTVNGRTKDEILGSIERSNVFGFGGAAFPTIRKIRAAIDANVGECHLIVNGVECDPGLIQDKWLLHNHVDNVVNGIRLLEKCLSLSSKTIAVKHDEGLSLPKDISVFRTRDYYPAGAERTLIRDVLKKTLPEGSIPAKQGIIVLNVQTMAAIYEAVCLDRKTDTRLITVAKMSDMSGAVARVRLGANMHDVAEKIYPGAVCVHSGGGMMNARMAADDAAIDETVNFIGVGVLPLYRESPLCSKCGYCNAVCPARLNVREIARLVDTEKTEGTTRLHPQNCMECGSCSHICLAGRNLAARVKKAKEGLRTIVTADTGSIAVQQETTIS